MIRRPAIAVNVISERCGILQIPFLSNVPEKWDPTKVLTRVALVSRVASYITRWHESTTAVLTL